MIKRLSLAVVQLAAFLGLQYVGGNWDYFMLSWEMRKMAAGQSPTPLMATIKYQVNPAHFLIAQGLIFTTALLVLILLGEAAAKKIRPYALDSVGMWVVAMIIALLIPGWALHAGTF